MSSTNRIWKCMIVDDEPLAREVIARYIERVPSLKLTAECGNAIEAMEKLKNEVIDILFLDIHMPEILGTDLIRIMKNPPAIIITTAFQEYALVGYELDIVDYLLKPIKFERFLKAITKAYRMDGEQIINPAAAEQYDGHQKEPFLYFRTDRKSVKVMLDDILYVEGMGNYVKIFMDGNVLITKNSMSTVETMLPEELFIRIHRSFIVAKSKITAYGSDTLEIGKQELPIGKIFKTLVLKKISS